MISHRLIYADLRWQETSSNGQENKCLLSVIKPPTSSSPVSPAGSVTTLACPKLSSERYLLPTATIYPSKATLSRRPSGDAQSQSDTNVSVGTASNAPSRTPSVSNDYTENGALKGSNKLDDSKKTKNERRVSAPPTDDLDVQSIINERRPSKLKCGNSLGMAASVGDQYPSSIRTGSYVYVTEQRSEEVSPISTGNMSDSIMASTSVSTSASASASASASSSGSGTGSGSRDGIAVVNIPEAVCTTIGSDVRIYVDDTDSTSSNSHHRRKSSEETPDGSTTVSSVTAVHDGTDVTEETKGRSERFDRACSGAPSDRS